MNQEVNVTSFYFNHGAQDRLFPRQIEIGDRQLSFIENGLRCLVQKGQELVQVFNMTDGQSLYRLSFEPGSRTWKLLSTRTL
ncbi:MAG TPA: hypothetical protein VM124_02270 [Candidatus Limnocylindrales bacterium]|nr:hypothetical protein [Candidatus Limnocylindrales bacterium]